MPKIIIGWKKRRAMERRIMNHAKKRIKCLENIKSNELYKTQCCSNVFHYLCFDKYCDLSKTPLCPLCRSVQDIRDLKNIKYCIA